MIVVISGVKGGIGQSLAEILLKKGDTIIGLSREGSNYTVVEDNKVRTNSLGIAGTDINRDDSILEAVKQIKVRFGHVDALVNCTGVASGGITGMIRREEIVKCVEANFVSPIMVAQAFVRLLKKSESASIVNVSSISAFRSDVGTISYGGAKAGLNQATRIMARELGPYGIRVNCVAPGVTDTPMLKLMDKKSLEMQLMASSISKVAMPNEVAEVISFLISPKSKHVNGQIIKVDGGQGI